MTQEQKAKAYDEALERAKNEYQIHKSFNGFREMLVRIFPSLKESNDEKIRKALINVFSTHKDYEMFFGVSVKDIHAWLERQGTSYTKRDVDDAFIEKAWDWIEDNMLSSNQQDKSLLYYELFKKYLEE